MDASQEPMFHRTGDIERQVMPFLEVAGDSQPRVRLIVSDRGMGKTSLLRYIEWSLGSGGITTFYVTAMESLGKGKTHIDLARGVLRDLLSRMLNEIVVNHRSTYAKFQNVIDYKLSLFGMSIIDGQVWTTGDSAVELGDVSKHLTELGQIYKGQGIRFAVFFDNLDKYDAPDTLETVYQLLRMPVSQSAFEILMTSGASIFLAVATPLYRRMQDEERGDFSYLDDPFTLNPLKPTEAHALLETRFRAKSVSKFPLEADAVVEVAADAAGNIRRIFKKTRRILEYGGEHELASIGRAHAVRAIREEQDYPSIMRELGNEPALLNGMHFVARLLRREVDPGRVRSFLKAAIRAHHNKRITPTDRRVLEQHSVGDVPIKRQGTTFLVNDQSLLDFVNFLSLEGVDAEGFVDWLLEGKTVPEFLLAEKAMEERLIDAVLQRLERVNEPLGKVRIVGRNTVTFDSSKAIAEVKRNLQTIRSELPLWGAGMAELSYPDQVVRVTQGLVSLYRALAVFSAGQARSEIDLSDGVIVGLVRAIEQGVPARDRGAIPVETIKKLVMLHSRIVHDRYSPSEAETEQVTRDSISIVRALARLWLRRMNAGDSETQALLKGEVAISGSIAEALEMSETGLGLLHVPGKTLHDFSLYFWRGEFTYWGLRNAGARSKSIAADIVRMTNHVQQVGSHLRLGTCWTDTNVLISGRISELLSTGIWKRAKLSVPPVIAFEYRHNASKELKSSVVREISRLRSAHRDEIASFSVSDEAPIGLEGVPGTDRQLNSRIDELFVRGAEEAGAFVVTSDQDQLAHASVRSKVLYLAAAPVNIFPIDSIRELLRHVLSSEPTAEIRIFNQFSSDYVVYRINRTEREVTALQTIRL